MKEDKRAVVNTRLRNKFKSARKRFFSHRSISVSEFQSTVDSIARRILHPNKKARLISRAQRPQNNERVHSGE